MPLLAKKIFNCAKASSDHQLDEKPYTISHTKEQFQSKDEFDKRLHLYKSRVWTCRSTGHMNLTHEEAWTSEKTVLKTLKEQFPPCYDKPVLELVHHSTQSLDSLVDQAWLILQQTLVVGERVLLKVKAGGKSMKAVVVKSDKAGCERNPTSNCSSPSSDKENTDKDDNASPKKWVPPKLLPYKYSIRFENEDSVIHSVPAGDLSRGDKPPSKELLRLFIRTYAVRAGQSGSSPWIVDDAQVKKLDLSNKFAGFLLSPVKWKADEIAKKLDEEVKKYKSPSKGSPRIKTKMEAKEEKKKEKAKKSLSKLQEKGERAKLAKEAAAKKSEVIELETSSDDEEETDTVKGGEKAMEISDSDSDTPLSVMKSQLSPTEKKLSISKDKASIKKKSESKKTDKKKSTSLADMKKKLDKKKNTSLAGLKEKMKNSKTKSGDSKKKEKGEKGEKKKSKKGQDPKQLTLFDLSKKKGLKTPEKKPRSPQKSPLKLQKTPDRKPKKISTPWTPLIVKKIQKAMKESTSSVVGTYVTQASKILSSAQRAKLPDGIREMVQKKYDHLQEKHKLSRMSESERKEYLAQQASKRRDLLRQQMKNLKKRYEDTLLDLKPLPEPKVVATPDGLPNEAFGDVTMITEFISCYSGLLMPDDEYPIYTDALMKALTTGKEGFSYLSRVLAVLLQTLLQDQIAEDYQDIKVHLNDIPVNPCTTSELVRLCLRKQDVTDDKSHSSNDEIDMEGSDEVPDELIQLLETQELFQLEPLQKLHILKGLCLRIMGTYSVQDYMEEKHQESSRLWREKFAQHKENKDKRLAKKEEEKLQKEAEKETKDKSGKESDQNEEKSVLLTHFYGKKNSDEVSTSGNTSETTELGDDDGDLASTVKRRRVTTAKAMEEKRKKEIEDRIRREKEMELYKEQKDRELFEKHFAEGIHLAKVTQRLVPIGTDRNHCRYWIFSDVTPGIYVEKGWVGDEMEYNCNKDAEDGEDDSSSSSESEDDEEEGTNTKRTKKLEKCLDKTFPHIGQNLWFSYGSVKDVDELLKCLHVNGSRESVLKKELQRKYQDINKAIQKSKRAEKELRKSDGDEEIKSSFQKELLETEMRLRSGGLGGVDDFTTWTCRLETSEDVTAMAECLLETQAAVLKRFRDGIMVVKKRKTEVKEEPEDDEGEEEELAPGIQRWRDAVKNAGTFSRLHVMLGIFDNCIKWEKSAENAKCKICRKKGDEDRLLLCDDCNLAFHMYCLRPALAELPHGDWHCPSCAPQHRKRIRDVPGRYKEDVEQADSDDDQEMKEVKTKSIKHETHCMECGADEHLIECAECPSVYHLECHDPPLRHPPRGRWVCNDCKNGITLRQRKNRQTKNSRGGGRKRKRYVESEEEEEDEDSETEESESDEPPRKVPKKNNGPRAKQKPKPKSSPKSGAGRPKGRKSVPSPEVAYESKPKVSRRAPSELSVMEDIVNQMLEYKDAWPFYHNVNKKDVPDYYNIIKQPISFQKIKDRLNCLVYGSPEEVLNAVALLFRNGVEYNKEGSEVFECLESSEKHFVKLLKDNLPMYVYNRGDKLSNGYNDHFYSDEGRKSRRSK